MVKRLCLAAAAAIVISTSAFRAPLALRHYPWRRVSRSKPRQPRSSRACNGGMRRAYVATRIAPGDVAERLKAAVCETSHGHIDLYRIVSISSAFLRLCGLLAGLP